MSIDPAMSGTRNAWQSEMVADARYRPALLRATWAVVGAAALIVFISLSHAWFTSPWSGSYEFYSGMSSGFAATGYPVRTVIHVMATTCLLTAAFVLMCAVANVVWRPSSWTGGRVHARVLAIATTLTFGCAVAALAFPPRDMVRFPTFTLCPAGYVAALAAGLAALTACSLFWTTRAEIGQR
jgi:hypothetical protein